MPSRPNPIRDDSVRVAPDRKISRTSVSAVPFHVPRASVVSPAIADDAEPGAYGTPIHVQAPSTLGHENASVGKERNGPRLLQPRHDDDAEIAVLGQRRFNQERTLPKRRIRPLDWGRTDVALRGGDLRVHAFRAHCPAAASLPLSPRS